MDPPIIEPSNSAAAAPSWGPLEQLFSAHECGAFMWMYRVAVASTVIERYKHIRTRRYLHLDHQGRAYQCSAPTESSDEIRYRPMPLGDAILHVLS